MSHGEPRVEAALAVSCSKVAATWRAPRLSQVVTSRCTRKFDTDSEGDGRPYKNMQCRVADMRHMTARQAETDTHCQKHLALPLGQMTHIWITYEIDNPGESKFDAHRSLCKWRTLIPDSRPNSPLLQPMRSSFQNSGSVET